MVALVGSMRFLGVAYFKYAEKRMEKQAELDSSVEKVKLDTAIQITTSLKGVVDSIIPIVHQHGEDIGELKIIHEKTNTMMSELSLQYESFQHNVAALNQGTTMALSRIKGIETEIIEMKSGNIFVRTKK
jgi:hypothetical protein